MVRINLPKMFKSLMIKAFFSKCAEQLENVSAGNWASIVTGEGHYKKAQLRDQLPEVANLITRRVPTRIRKVTKRPTKLQGCKVVRALFTDCANFNNTLLCFMVMVGSPCSVISTQGKALQTLSGILGSRS